MRPRGYKEPLPLLPAGDPPEVEPARRDQDLLAIYLWLSPARRGSAFASTTQIAREIGLSRRAVLYWIQNGSLRSIRIGKKHLIWRDSLVRYLEVKNSRR